MKQTHCKNLNAYLSQLSSRAIIGDSEKEGISRSVSTLSRRLRLHFGDDIYESFIFGSYSRGTMLPRSMDKRADVDYMVVFRDEGLKPQTYLSKLRQFAEKYYSRSEIAQSHPTIVLSLNHIMFELVPAIRCPIYGLQIPAKASDYVDWITTDPLDLKEHLKKTNSFHNHLIKPLIRVMKYWNALNGHPIDSYFLEKDIVNHFDDLFFLHPAPSLKFCFYDYVSKMSPSSFNVSKTKEASIQRLKETVLTAMVLDNLGSNELACEIVQGKLFSALSLLNR